LASPVSSCLSCPRSAIQRAASLLFTSLRVRALCALRSFVEYLTCFFIVRHFGVPNSSHCVQFNHCCPFGDSGSELPLCRCPSAWVSCFVEIRLSTALHFYNHNKAGPSESYHVTDRDADIFLSALQQKIASFHLLRVAFASGNPRLRVHPITTRTISRLIARPPRQTFCILQPARYLTNTKYKQYLLFMSFWF
jgi:hypothetical protein